MHYVEVTLNDGWLRGNPRSRVVGPFHNAGKAERWKQALLQLGAKLIEPTSNPGLNRLQLTAEVKELAPSGPALQLMRPEPEEVVCSLMFPKR